ncbi:unnamed protein product [Toxocara canis]|uniref:Str_synth domain-containing protein n=1 Tax=Toxocara canis TaxID=6265 RepID=A0A183V3Z4_TOXCA|nr:unnamed protein product [Toxocara canis]
MDYLKLLSTIFSLLTTLLSATEKKSCSLKDLDITPQSSYVIYGIRHDGRAFSFTEADVHHARSTPDQYLNKITTELTTSNTAPSHFYSEITLTESNGVLHRILRRRSHNSNQLDADTNGIPHRSEFIYLGNRRSQLQTGATLTLFSIPETNHTRYYLKHSDEYGLHGGFLKLPYITVFEIKGRRMKDIKIRLKIMRRPDQFLYTDDSRLWNYGEDLNVTHIIDRLGKEWQFAFRTVNARGLCIASEGMPNLDLHILWRHNRRLRSVYNRTETKDNFLAAVPVISENILILDITKHSTKRTAVSVGKYGRNVLRVKSTVEQLLASFSKWSRKAMFSS